MKTKKLLSKKGPKALNDSEKWRVVFDTNVFVAAILSKNEKSPNRELIRRWLNDEFILIISQALTLELIEKLDAKGVRRTLILDLLSNLDLKAKLVMVKPADVPSVIVEDPDDNQVIACAVVGGAQFILTYDPHFVVLGGEYKGIKIMEPIPFLIKLRVN